MEVHTAVHTTAVRVVCKCTALCVVWYISLVLLSQHILLLFIKPIKALQPDTLYLLTSPA